MKSTFSLLILLTLCLDVYSQFDNSDLVDTRWFSDNSDSLFYKSDTIELIKYVFPEIDENFKRNTWEINPKLFLNRRWIRRNRVKYNDDEAFNDFTVFAFERKRLITIWNAYDGGYMSQGIDGYNWRWEIDKTSQTIRLNNNSSNMSIMTFEIIEIRKTEFSQSHDDESTKTIILKIKKTVANNR